MKKQLAILGLLVALLVGACAPSFGGTAAAASHTPARAHLFDKTRFAFHLGLAYFAFHHFVYKPYRAGAFRAGSPHRTRSIIKAGVALLVTAHEVRKAYDIARKSNSRVLHALIKPMDTLIAKSNAVANKLRGGQYNDAEVRDIVNSANGFSRQATKNGISIKDVPVPGLGS